MRRIHLRSAFAVLIGCIVSSCGGSGGGGGGGDFGNGLAIDTTSLSFTAAANQTPPSKALHATITATDAATVSLGYAAGAQQVAWLQGSIPPGQSPANVAINVNVTPLATPGTYTAHPAVAIFRSDGSVIALRGLTVTYQVTP